MNNKIEELDLSNPWEESHLKVKEEIQEKATQHDLSLEITDENQLKPKNKWRFNTEKIHLKHHFQNTINSNTSQKNIISAPLPFRKI